MFFLDLVYALIIGTTIAWIWSSAFDTHGPWNSFFWFFLVIFLFSWGGGAWSAPFGPTGWGVAWLPFLCMGVFMALLLTAATPRASRRRTRYAPEGATAAEMRKRAVDERKIEASFDIFFWMLILVMASFALTRYFWFGRAFR
jgi:hypothetical protein